ncbi:hypothetical protein ANME2D_02112 [Candidatus Methanoperedens nitroreducens]|uniref:Uncharacterized protein n=1 Tax=Candidatus Methanoperedens nitratireducens TaxID=1392998 RepID=A0A062V6I1_9EURY|nr:hypothetical protein [Candidatus Methanoperedens nitroreducens]KCZ71384.1 hypothetical protein ANME2D_02112 [Candidatus Methanoperedens nitroreducens]MDJ1421013.1 hypothetical protein [Candidatus Methanoperedens sp.]
MDKREVAKFHNGGLASWCAGILNVLSLAFLIGFIVLFTNPETALGLPSWAWMRRYFGIPGRIHYTLVMLAVLAFIWWLAYWNLI